MSTWDGQPRRKSDEDIGEIKINVAKLVVGQENIVKLLQKHDDLIYGNGTPGLKTRLDRLEQNKIQHDKHAMVGWSAMVGLVLKTVWDFFTVK